MARQVRLEDVDKVLALLSQGKESAEIAEVLGLPLRVVTAIGLNKYCLIRGRVVILP